MLYPDLEMAADVSAERIKHFRSMGKEEEESWTVEEESSEMSDDLLSLFGSFVGEAVPAVATKKDFSITIEKMELIADRAKATINAEISSPFYELCRKLEMDPFTVFCFACGILASTQTDYAGVAFTGAWKYAIFNGGFS